MVKSDVSLLLAFEGKKEHVPFQALIDQFFLAERVKLVCGMKKGCLGTQAQFQWRLLSPVNAIIVVLGRWDGKTKQSHPVSFEESHYFSVWDSNPARGCKRFKKPLISIVCHRGKSPASGHYVAYVRDPRSGSWYEYDDESISQVPWSFVKSQREDVYSLVFGPGIEMPKVP